MYYATWIFVGLGLPSINLAFDFAALDDLEDELDLGEEVDLDFFLFCFFGMLGSSVEGMSPNISDPDCCRRDSPKSRDDHGESAEPELPIEVAA